jgi:hypothetical protein
MKNAVFWDITLGSDTFLGNVGSYMSHTAYILEAGINVLHRCILQCISPELPVICGC